MYGDFMRTLLSSFTNKIIIKNSQFICILVPINDEQIEKYLNDIRLQYPKANHYCYAYIFNNVKHSSDDGEPSGTAGMPILNVLEKEGLNNVLCVVVRYFGGIKLGAGGLVRAYTKSVTENLKKATFVELIQGYKILLQFNYDSEKEILYILNNSFIESREYLEKISYTCYVSDEVFYKLDRFEPIILEKLYIKK